MHKAEELFPSLTRRYFIECSGNGRSAYRTPKPEMTPQEGVVQEGVSI